MREYFDRLDIYFQATIATSHIEASHMELEEYLRGYQDMSEGNDISDIMNFSFRFGTVLHMAARYGRDDLIEMFLRYGAQINQLGDGGVTALYIAVEFRQLNVIRALLRHEADPLVRDAQNMTVIDVAMAMGYYDVLELLIPNQTLPEGVDPTSVALSNITHDEAVVVWSSMVLPNGLTLSGEGSF